LALLTPLPGMFQAAAADMHVVGKETSRLPFLYALGTHM